MDTTLGSGDTHRAQPVSPRYTPNRDATKTDSRLNESVENCEQEKTLKLENITPQSIEDHEIKLKDRIAQCRNVIESLKLELNDEKAKLEIDTKSQFLPNTTQTMDDLPNFTSGLTSGYYNMSTYNDIFGDLSLNTDMYSACVDSKLNCDENLMEYEKQLEKYQTTLNMAQIEKKNAIRKQMLAKAYKLKLLELENQCNIELLRVKQSLQCLEPLQMIANKWKIGSDEGAYDLDKFELMPCYPEISSTSGVEVEAMKDEPLGSEYIDAKDLLISE